MVDKHVVAVPSTVYEQAKVIGEQRDMSLKEAVRYMCREGDFDV
jgi:hypothetical protein